MPKFGLLLVTGNHTHQETYARAFAADPRCRLVGLTDEPGVSMRRRALNLRLAAELDVPYLDEFDAALRRTDVDFVSICAEPERRGPLTIAAAKAGKHVYLDKEPASSVAGARAVADAVKVAGVRSQTFSLVQSSFSQRAKRRLASGELGNLAGVHCEMFFAKGHAGSADLSRPRTEKADVPRLTFIDSKRELLCVGWYPLVLFQWLTGQRAVRVSGTTSNYFFAGHQKNDVEDFACLMLEYENGLQATITVGRTGWASHPHNGIQQLHLVGDAGTATLDAFEPRLELYSDASPWRPPATPHPEDPMGFWNSTNRETGLATKSDWHPIEPTAKSDAAAFLDCLEQNRESEVPAALGADVLATIFAAYEAAATGRTVEVRRS